MTRAKSELVEYKKDRENGSRIWVYELSHSNKETTLRQDFIINLDKFGRFKLDVKFDDFPELSTKKENAKKMADWLMRLSLAIRSGVKEGVFND
ncbi:hypothetical protein DES39_0524 [Orbus hercynius]|uniref:Uncharacterized protein n=1 Tax=Orbus hercynius TaxID=593135 RepID=A0A495RJ43_9GAMM|nr:hypothetical protein [Orbus hercynius]RKS87304.1 hypothetical protein DES39_0524 [Orbus hercynius]